MKTYLDRQRALSDHNISPKELDELYRTKEKKKRVLIKAKLGDGTEKILIDADEIITYVAQRDIKPEHFSHLSKTLIGMTEGALKYNVTPTTLWRWSKNNLLEVVKVQDGIKMVRESDVAYLVAFFKAHKTRQGFSPFSSKK